MIWWILGIGWLVSGVLLVMFFKGAHMREEPQPDPDNNS